ncbi:hypothetical protein BgiMline_005674 [Biomphalaria glabrata]
MTMSRVDDEVIHIQRVTTKARSVQLKPDQFNQSQISSTKARLVQLKPDQFNQSQISLTKARSVQPKPDQFNQSQIIECRLSGVARSPGENTTVWERTQRENFVSHWSSEFVMNCGHGIEEVAQSSTDILPVQVAQSSSDIRYSACSYYSD